MLRVGLTGGIACGKSLVADFFRDAGIPVVNDDDAARDAVAIGTPGLAAVVEAFGPQVLGPDGTLDRPALGRIVFADPEQRLRLMNATFPFIGRLVLERIQAAEETGAPMLVYESALLVENRQAENWRPLVVVWAPPEIQISRLRARNQLSEEDARNRIASQMAVEEKRALADHAIDNSGTPGQTRACFDSVLEELYRKARSQ